MFKTYYRLAKPGIIYGNILTAAGGFLLASQGDIDWRVFAAMAVGTSLVIGSACVFNNYIDRDIDKQMKRTAKRAIASGEVSGRSALLYASMLGIVGLLILAAGTNMLTVIIGLVGFVAYVFLYGYAKRHTVHGTLVGTISGATPIVAGYCAVTGRLDAGALILFLIMVCWQMPHFYAIAMYRRDDYAAAGIPVLSVVKGMRATKIQIIAYAAAFFAAVVLLTAFGYAGYSFLIVVGGIGIYWLWRGIQGLRATGNVAWARKMFGLSLLVLLALSFMLALDAWLP